MTQGKADDLIYQLALLIVADTRYADHDWSAISIVAIRGGGGSSQVSGYSYDGQGTPVPGTPRNTEIDDLFGALQSATTVEGKEPWKSCLFQIKRSDMKAMIDLEYDDALRWKVTPANIKTRPIELRPA